MNNIIFGGIYSPKYTEYYKKIHNDLSKHIPTSNIEYKLIPQKVFDRRKDRVCVWCGKNPCTFVFHNGEKCKIEYQLELYKKYRNTEKIIFFTDCDIHIIHDNFDKTVQMFNYILNNSNTVDIIFQKEGAFPTNRWKCNINIGLTICKSTDKIINFYEQVLNFMDKNSYPDTWDQQVINHFFHAKLTDLKYNLTPNSVIFNHYKIGGNTDHSWP